MITNKLSLTARAAVMAGVLFASLAAHAADGPNDAQIVGIVMEANKLDIGYAKMAISKSTNPKVRELARHMMKDHMSLEKAVEGLAKKLHVMAQSSDTQKMLMKSGMDVNRKLRMLKGMSFDKFYVDNEVGYHQLVVKANEETLIPSAQNDQLKAALQGAQPVFQEHLEHAQMVQSGMMGKMDHMKHGK